MKKAVKSILALTLVIALLAACGQQAAPPAEEGGAAPAPAAAAAQPQPAAPAAPAGDGVPAEGADTNNGRPFNSTPIAWDGRDTSRYLHGVNLTILPIVNEPLTIDLWRPFSSTVISSLEESEVWIEMERRTGLTLNWFHPPVNQDADNFTLRIAADDLPHVFINAPTFPGGPARAIEEGIYMELTPFYERGYMPNFAWLRANHPEAAEIRRGTTDDLGRILGFRMIDIVPTHPWSGLWIRQDYLDNLGLSVPNTIPEWDYVLRAFREYTGSFVLGHRLDHWYGTETNHQFAGSFGASFANFINENGTARFGAAVPGFRDYLELMNSWWEAGILDPDFATRSHDDYFSNMARGFLAFGAAYGEIGQAKMTGQYFNPDWAVTPLANPAPAPGVPVRLSSQNNSIVRGDQSFVTDRSYNEGIIEYVIRLFDYFYSQDGGDLMSYGIYGHTSTWAPDGSIQWIHPSLGTPGADFWTLTYQFKMRPMSFLRDSSAYHFEPEVWECIAVWGAADNSWVFPDLYALTPDEASEWAGIVADLQTHRMDQSLAFIIGARPIDQFDAYVAELEAMGLRRGEQIYQAALDRFLAR